MDTLPRSRSLRKLYSSSHGDRNTIATELDNNNNGNHNSMNNTLVHPALATKYKKPRQNLADAAAQAEWASKKWVWCPDPVLGYVAGWIVKEEQEMAIVACVDDKVHNGDTYMYNAAWILMILLHACHKLDAPTLC